MRATERLERSALILSWIACVLIGLALAAFVVSVVLGSTLFLIVDLLAVAANSVLATVNIRNYFNLRRLGNG